MPIQSYRDLEAWRIGIDLGKVGGGRGALEPIVATQVLVALHRVPNQPVRLIVEADDPQVQRVRVEDDPNLRALGRRGPGLRDLLLEVGCRNSAPPHLFVETAVEHDGFALTEPYGGDHRARIFLGGCYPDAPRAKSATHMTERTVRRIMYPRTKLRHR